MKEYTSRAAGAIFALFLAVVLMGVVPPIEIFGLELRRFDMLSLFGSDADMSTSTNSVFSDNVEYEFDIASINEEFEQGLSYKSVKLREHWVIDSLKVAHMEVAPLLARPIPLITDGEVAIEDFDTTGHSAMERLYEKMLHPDSLTRIAFMGDSFVEGDILTSDLREILQLRYGGSGAGFAPVSSPLTKFRRTIATTSKGWKSNNVMQRKSAAAADVDKFTIAGWLSRPSSSSASVEWRMVEAKRGCERAKSARLLFLAQRRAEVEVEINDGAHRRRFTFEGSEMLRTIDIEADSIYSLKMSVLSGSSGFAGYGAIFDGGSGVCVDNYSVRSNSGHAMFWSNAALNAQTGRAIGGYDLVVLQYGLNIMAQDVFVYTSYAERLSDMVEYVRGCFPGAAVLILGVSERYTKQGDKYERMNSIDDFAAMQREVAQGVGAAFWQTDKAFTIRGGMPHFVDSGWAGKDYTHINFNGGQQVGHTLADALNMAIYNYAKSRPSNAIYEPLIPESERGELFKGQRIELKLLPMEVTPHKGVGHRRGIFNRRERR